MAARRRRNRIRGTGSNPRGPPRFTSEGSDGRTVLICGSVFSGIGLLDYGLHQAGIKHAWFCEADEWRRGILRKRWPDARVHADVRHVGHGCEPVDLIAGGFPCKGASTAGKRNGFDHAETVLWREMRRAICELQPRYVLVENVANILALGGTRQHDRCVCGWPYRRRGLHLPEAEAEVVHGSCGRGDEPEGGAGAEGASCGVRRDPKAGPGCDGSPCGEMAMDIGRPERRGDIAAVAAVPVAQDGAGAIGAEGGRTPGCNGDASSMVASGSDGRGDRDCDADQGDESDWPDDGTCPACGRDVVESSSDVGGAVWGEVLGDLAALGYDVVWDCVPAGAVGAPHRRDRVFAVASYADGGGSQAGAQQDQRTPGGLRAPLRHDADRRGVRVEWGDYEPAIRRWEAIHGPAPAPLVQRIRGMDDRSAARVERSRLSALGDGVQCQVGRIAGEYIVSLERARLAGAAPSMIPGAARTG
jgi:site-specific DNA-cytosine methylase